MAHHMSRRCRLVGAAGICLFALLLAASPTTAADQPDGITVTGVGTAKARPTAVEIEGLVSADGELAADAKVKYLDIKKKAVAALEALKDPALSIESLGPSISQEADANQQMRMMQGMGAGEAVKQKVQITEQIRLVLKGIDKQDPDKLVEAVLKLIDTARDAGLHVGAPPATNYYEMRRRAQMGGGDALAAFKISDKTEIESKAYQLAVADARAKAQRIADLNGVKLGRVLSVSDPGPAENEGDQNSATQMIMMIYGFGGGGGTPNGELNSMVLAEIPLTVHLIVKFEIAK